MMGLRKPQRLAKLEVAEFICYENIREFVFKNWDKPKWGNPLLFGEIDFTVGFADPMFPIRYATVVELRLQQMGDFLFLYYCVCCNSPTSACSIVAAFILFYCTLDHILILRANVDIILNIGLSSCQHINILRCRPCRHHQVTISV